MIQKKRKLVFALLVFLGVAIAVEGLCRLAWWRLHRIRPDWVEGGRTLDPSHIQALRNMYHPEWGWDVRYATPWGERPRRREGERILVATYGDSFVHGDGVADEETWQNEAARLLGADVLNFGVSAYGTDQALLKFRVLDGRIAPPIVVMGAITENVNRCVNVYRRFYDPKTWVALTKPRFRLVEGRLTLLPNPTRRVEDLERLATSAGLLHVARNDFWAGRTPYPRMSFPYSRLLVSSRVWLDLWHGRQASPRPWEHLLLQAEVRALYLAILCDFRDRVRARGGRPVILLIPQEHEARIFGAEGTLLPEWKTLVGEAEAKGLEVWSGLDLLAGRLNGPGAVATLYAGHLSPEGHRVFGRGFARKIQDVLAQ